MKPCDEFSPDKRNRSGLDSWCKACRRAYKKERAEQERESGRRYRQKNADRVRDKLRRWRKANPEKTREQCKRFHQNHLEQRRADARERTKRNYRKNKAAYYAHVHTRRARLRNAEGSFTAAEWEELKTHYAHRCLCCGLREPEIKLTVDHVIPISRGGSNEISNIQPLCLTCNLSKSTKSIDYRS